MWEANPTSPGDHLAWTQPLPGERAAESSHHGPGNSLPPGGGEAAICTASSGAEGARLGSTSGAQLPESWQREGWCLLGLEANKVFHLGPPAHSSRTHDKLGLNQRELEVRR